MKPGERIRKELARDQKRASSGKLSALRRELRAARARRAKRLDDLRRVCRAKRNQLRDRARELRAALAVVQHERKDLSHGCAAGRVAHRGESASEIARARERLASERAEQRALRTLAKPREAFGRTESRPVRKAGPTAAERTSESDEAVAIELPPELLPFWEQVKRRIKPTVRKSRLEVFLEYVEQNPGDAWEAAEADQFSELQRLEAEAYAS